MVFQNTSSTADADLIIPYVAYTTLFTVLMTLMTSVSLLKKFTTTSIKYDQFAVFLGYILLPLTSMALIAGGYTNTFSTQFDVKAYRYPQDIYASCILYAMGSLLVIYGIIALNKMANKYTLLDGGWKKAIMSFNFLVMAGVPILGSSFAYYYNFVTLGTPVIPHFIVVINLISAIFFSASIFVSYVGGFRGDKWNKKNVTVPNDVGISRAPFGILMSADVKGTIVTQDISNGTVFAFLMQLYFTLLLIYRDEIQGTIAFLVWGILPYFMAQLAQNTKYFLSYLIATSFYFYVFVFGVSAVSPASDDNFHVMLLPPRYANTDNFNTTLIAASVASIVITAVRTVSYMGTYSPRLVKFLARSASINPLKN